MNIKELKKKIEDNNLEDNQLILKLSDESSWFIAKQYIRKIAENKNLIIKYIDSFSEIPDTSFIEDNNLYILKVNELKDFEVKDNTIIVCYKYNKKDCINVPQLEKWQFQDYIKSLVPGLNEKDIEWLLTQYEFTYDRETKVNYFRMYNDMKKISLFSKSTQQGVFEELYSSGDYKDISNLTIFDLSNALIRRDSKMALEVLKVFDYIDSKPHVWLLSIMLNNIRKVIDVQSDPNSSAERLGISDKQYYVIKKYNCNHYNIKQLLNIYKMLTELEYKYKFEGLTQDMLADYIVCKILGE